MARQPGLQIELRQTPRVHGDGDGWVICGLGHRHWGRHGAAGLLLRAPGRIVLQHRAARTHEGDTWGLPGGARDSHESAVQTALREAAEEAAIRGAAVGPFALSVDDHGGWSYTTVLARELAPVRPHAANWESEDVRWCALDEVGALPLHPGFAASWPQLASATRPVRVVVDMANVVGARPDGWWRNRAAANARLHDRIAELAVAGIDVDVLPAGVDVTGLTRLLPDWVLVVEGQGAQGQAAGSATADGPVATVAAPGIGDDEVLTQVAAADGPVVVVTADAGLRARVAPQPCVGPGWLLGQLDALAGLDARPERG